MITTRNELIAAVWQATQTAFPAASITVDMVDITQSTQAKFGHYQCNSAMKLTGLLHLNPRQIAQKILAHLNTVTTDPTSMISECIIAGPGFINITLSPHYIAERVQAMLHHPTLGIATQHNQQTIIIDFSSPNIAKEMHVGHLRSTIIGDCLARLFEFLGYNVLRLNHVGDWGTAFGMLIAYMKQQVPATLTSTTTDFTLTHLVAWYRAAKVQFDADPEFKKRAQQEVVALQNGDSSSLHAWTMICAISRQAYQEIYDLLAVRITERGESFYNSMLANVVTDLEKKGLVTVSQGAKCIFLEGFTNREGELLPLMIQKSDGGFNYATTDLAALQHRSQEEHAQRIIYVTDAGQTLHFQMIFKAAEHAGYVDPRKTEINHVPFGLVLGPDGKKFRTRAGETERLIDLLTTAIQQATHILTTRNTQIDSAQLTTTATALGINAIKYADLSCHRTHDYTFSYDKMLRFEGNTAAFLMYAYVRINGIKRKIGVDVASLLTTTTVAVTHPTEIALGVQLIQFSETIEQMSIDLYPHRLTEYLYHLAESFNAFFRDCRVEGDVTQNSRLLLCEAVAQVMRQGLRILGLTLLEKM